MTITLTRHSTLVSASPAEIEEARAVFDGQHCLLLPRLLEPGLLDAVQRGIAAGEFYERTHEGIGEELCLKPDTTTAMLEFLVNDERLFQVIRQLTGCGTIGCFEGRVYRMAPGTGHYDSWHSDVGQDRLIAMSINLSPEPYVGGLLQIREAASKQVLYQVANVGLGDAILFRIDPSLRHRVTALEGSVPRTAYAGWFRSQPEYQSLLFETMSRRQSEPVA